MRRLAVPFVIGGLVLIGGWYTGTEGAALPGLMAGLGLGIVIIALLGSAGVRLGHLLRHTRLEDRILAWEQCPSDWPEQIEQTAAWLDELAAPELQNAGEPVRRFVWQDDLPQAEILAEVER